VNYADTALTRRMRKEIEAVNTIMAEIEVRAGLKNLNRPISGVSA
jgi:hypothetical protein